MITNVMAHVGIKCGGYGVMKYVGGVINVVKYLAG